MGLKLKDLSGTVVGVDTAIFIYFIEEHPAYLPVLLPLFDEVAAGKRTIVTSGITLLEVLVVPLRVGSLALAERYETLLTRSRGVDFVDVSREQLRTAAQLRALYDVRTPDALQLAAALSRECATFLTNDRPLPQFPGLRVLQLGECLT
ncbi:MAG: type II toxin-antitoxin system VapC family toxin [Gemmatimonadales bacterium]